MVGNCRKRRCPPLVTCAALAGRQPLGQAREAAGKPPGVVGNCWEALLPTSCCPVQPWAALASRTSFGQAPIGQQRMKQAALQAACGGLQ
eukprot:7262400-Alexandrium_andersonii.AAC.1